MKVLIVDDNRDVADSLGALLQLVLGCDVCIRYSGESALAIAGNYRPDAVVLDINMPGIDGLQTARALKSDRRLRGALFVAQTGAAELLAQRVVQRIGFEHIVRKGDPSAVPTIVAALERVQSRVQR